MVRQNKIIIGFKDSSKLAKDIAKQKKLLYKEVSIKKFPDGEDLIIVPDNVKGKEVYLVRTMFDPNEKFLEVLFCAHTLKKDFKAKKVILIAPYLCYMRQDKRFHKGEVVSSKIMARLFDEYLDGLITIDPHLHRIHKMSDLFKVKSKRLTANKILADYIKKNVKNPIIIGPDGESFQWARNIAEMVGCKSTVMVKKRFSGRKIKNKFVEDIDVTGYNVVIVDDIISTGNTIIGAIKNIRKMKMKAKGYYAIGVHGVLIENAVEKLKKSNINLVTTNTIPNKTSKIDISKLIADSI